MVLLLSLNNNFNNYYSPFIFISHYFALVSSSLNLKTRIYLWYLKLKLYWPFRFAHHPLCPRFSGHVFKIGRLYLCQGCTYVYFGLILGGLIFGLVPIAIPFWLWLTIAACLILPTFLVHFLSLPRFFTRLARFLLGLYFGWMIGAIVQYSSWLYRGLFIGIGFTSYLIFRIIYRRTKRLRDECSGCSELEQSAVCSGFEVQLAAEREYSRIATKLLESDLEALVRKKIPSYDSHEEIIPSQAHKDDNN